MHDFGVRTRDQLLADGVPAGTIDSRARNGAYTRLLPGTYCITEPTKLAQCAAVMSWQSRAVLSHRTAAWLYGWCDEPDVVEATVPHAVKVKTPSWLRLYRRTLDSAELVELQSLPIVTREQALLDCLAVLSPDEAARLVDESCRFAVDPIALELLASKTPGRSGNGALAKQLRQRAIGFASEPERLLARAFRARDFDIAANARVGPYVGDFVDVGARVVVEVDWREFHCAPDVFRNDRRRQNWLVRDGWFVLRYAAADVLADPHKVADEVITDVRRRRKARGR
ncbi:DUF559 domain-containing protein [Antrihabitans spumae]|uniref:DUF559 domain-containing protein n=1 Tax=Antrihabitans spumae TaxID=3373370 RepID=A0ABW7K1B8_9NOCA